MVPETDALSFLLLLSTFTTNTGIAGAAEAGAPAEVTQGRLSLLQEGEIPGERWLTFFNQLDKEIRNESVTVELRENGETRTLQRDMPIDGFGADVRARANSSLTWASAPRKTTW
jgi:hypothetical protein